MSEINAIKSKRYPGLIKQAIRLHAEVEEKGWKLAEVIYEAMQELWHEGFTLIGQYGTERQTAVRRVAGDVGLSVSSTKNYYYTWKKYSDPSKRAGDLTFSDHVRLTLTPAVEGDLRERRKRIAKGGKAPTPQRSVDPLNPYQKFSGARSNLGALVRSNIWDYPDREKALAYAQEIQQLAQEVLVKFGGQKDAKPATRRRVKAAA